MTLPPSPGFLAALVGLFIRWWRTRPGTGRHARRPRHNKRTRKDPAMTDDDDPDRRWPTPIRREPRGDPPEHVDAPATGPVPREIAARLARRRLEQWRREHYV